MTNLRDLIGSARAGLPAPRLARWAAVLFSLSVLTFLISLSASEAFLAAAGVMYAAHLLRDHPHVNFPPVKLPLALFCLLSVLSVFGAANPTVGWFAVRKLVLFLIWLLAANLIVTAGHLRGLLKAVFLTSALAGIVAFAQFVLQYRDVRVEHPGQFYLYMISTRVHGFMGHWMNFGGQQMLVFSVLLAFLLLSGSAGERPAPTNTSDSRFPSPDSRPPVPASRFWWPVLAIVVVSIVLNFTRGVWLGCFVATVYLVARWKARWLGALPVLLAVAFLASPSLVRHRVWLAVHPTQDPALAIRFEMWQVALRMIRQHPWLGVGPNNIEREYVLYLPPGKPPEVGYHSHFHNNFFQFGAERGLPCLAAWVWLMAALGWHIVKARRRLWEWRWLADGALAAWLALLAEGCFEFNFGTSPVLMVFLFVACTPFVAEQMERGKESA